MQLAGWLGPGQGPRAALADCPQRINDIRSDIARVIDDFALTIASINYAKRQHVKGYHSPIIVPVRPANQEPFYLWTPLDCFWPHHHISGVDGNHDGRFQVEILTQMLLQGMMLRGRPQGHSRFAWFHHESPWHEKETNQAPQLLLRGLFEILRSKVQNNEKDFRGHHESHALRHGDLELFTANRFHFNGFHITFNPVTTCATFSLRHERYYLIEGFWDAVLENAELRYNGDRELDILELEASQVYLPGNAPHAELDYVLRNHIEEAHKCTF